jgi:hypothetical protein
MTDKVREQILKVRDTGKTNMLDTYTVQRIGLKMRLYDMVIFIEENRDEYVNFILHGDEKARRTDAKTRFEKDYAMVMEGEDDAERIILQRKNEIRRLRREGRECRNGFRMQCIQQELERLEHELEILVDLL